MNADTALDFPVQPLRPGQLADPALPHLSWLWHGFLARGRMTALVGSSKSGKTTLASLLLARSGQCGQLAGLSVAPTRAFVISEEPCMHSIATKLKKQTCSPPKWIALRPP